MGTARLKVAFLANAMSGGGAERALIELLRNLDRSRFDVTLILSAVKGALLDDVPSDIPIRTLGVGSALKDIVRSICRLREVLSIVEPNIVVSTVTNSNRLLLRASAWMKWKYIVVAVEQNNLSLSLLRTRSRVKRFVKTREIRLLYRMADRVVAVSAGVREDLVKRHKVGAAKVGIIPNMVDIAGVRGAAEKEVGIPGPAGTPVAVAVGRLVEQKGFRDLVEAFARINSVRPVRLMILGEGPLRAELESMISAYGLRDRIHLLGFVANPWAFMKRGRVLVSASHWEGFPLTVLEGMACRIPIVHTDCDFGPREVLRSGENGILVPVGSPDRLAAAVLEMLSNEGAAARLAARGAMDVRAYRAPLVAREYEKLFEEVLAERPIGGLHGFEYSDSSH